MRTFVAPLALLGLAVTSHAAVVVTIDNPIVTLVERQRTFILYGTVDATESTESVTSLFPRVLSSSVPGSNLGSLNGADWPVTLAPGQVYSGELLRITVFPTEQPESGTIEYVLEAEHFDGSSYTVLGKSGPLSVSYVNVVPEPASLLSLAGAAILSARKRRRLSPGPASRTGSK